jgi:hypothetical protein
MSSDKETKGIRAIMILDIIGRPPEYLTETLGKMVEAMNEEKGVKVINKKISVPVFIKDRTDFYTSFAEIEIEVEQISNLAILMFKYMPAHVEVLSPELLVLSNGGWSDILSELTTRLHAYEEVARITQTEKGILEKKLRELLESPAKAGGAGGAKKSVKKVSKKIKKK